MEISKLYLFPNTNLKAVQLLFGFFRRFTDATRKTQNMCIDEVWAILEKMKIFYK